MVLLQSRWKAAVAVLITGILLFALNMSLPHLFAPEPEPIIGYAVETISDDLGAPTCIDWIDEEWLLVCDNEEDSITMHRFNGSTVSRSHHLATGFEQPQGALIDMEEGILFVSDRGRLTRFDLNGSEPATWVAENRTTLVSGIPSGNHQTNAVEFAANGSLIWHSGSTCNVCEEADGRNAALLWVDPESGEHSVIATGVRNSYDGVLVPGVGYVFTDNGRDWDGDDSPFEELNLFSLGHDYGWPDDVPSDPIPAGTIGPIGTFTPHSSANGIALRPAGSSIPGTETTVFVTTYGSWNAAIPTGSELIRVDLIPDENSDQGWRSEVKVIVEDVPGALGIAFHPDGTLTFAQHGHGRLLRLTHSG